MRRARRAHRAVGRGRLAALRLGVRLLPTARLARAAQPLAGAVVALCGVAILVGL